MPTQTFHLNVWTLSVDERRHVVCATREAGTRRGARLKCCRRSSALVPIDDGTADYPNAIVLIRLRSSMAQDAPWINAHFFRNWDNVDVVDGPLLAVVERRAKVMARRLLPPRARSDADSQREQAATGATRHGTASARQARLLREAKRMHIQP